MAYPNQPCQGFLLGTPEYIPPEVWLEQKYSEKGDVWALGIMVYEMVCGYRPFGQNMLISPTPDDIRDHILMESLTFPSHVSAPCQDLIASMLDKNMNTRINIHEVFNHFWFEDIDWCEISGQRVDAPFILR